MVLRAVSLNTDQHECSRGVEGSQPKVSDQHGCSHGVEGSQPEH